MDPISVGQGIRALPGVGVEPCAAIVTTFKSEGPFAALFGPRSDPAKVALRSLLPVPAEPVDGRPCDYWQGYVGAAMAQTPQLRRAVTSFAKRVRHSPPAAMAQVFDKAYAAAKTELGRGVAHLDEPAQRRYLTASALLVLAAHTFRHKELRADEKVIQLFPRYLRDGRLNDIGYDKACHYWSHAFVSYFLLYDADYGTGQLQRVIDKLETIDQLASHVDAIGRHYHEGRGRPGALMKAAKPVASGPSDYLAPEPYGSAAEQAAYDASVRGGYLYKHYRTIDAFGPYALSDIGQAGPSDAWIHDSTRLQSGLWDAGVVRDLVANDLGARAGIELYRAPGASPTVRLEGTPVVQEPDPGTHARASAIAKALAAKDVTPHRLLVLAIERAPPIFGLHAELGGLERTDLVNNGKGWKITSHYQNGVASLTYDPTDQRADEAALVHLRIKAKNGPAGKVSMPTTDLPTRSALKVDAQTRSRSAK